MMIKYFVTKKEITKVSILNTLLISKKRVFLKDIMNSFNVSKNTTLRYMNELEKDLSTVFSDVHLVISKDNNYFISYNNIQDHAFLINKMKEYYIQNSSLFLTFKEVIQTDKSIIQISSDLNFSSSTIYSKIALLNEVTQPFNVEINFFENGRFKGEESSIRFFLYKMILFENKINKDNPFGPKMPLSFLNLDNITSNLLSIEALSSSQMMRLKMIQGITLYRMNIHNQYLGMNQQLAEDITFFDEDNFKLPDNKSMSTAKLNYESSVFCFIIRATIFDVDTHEKKYDIVQKYQQSNLEIARQTEAILSYFSKAAHFNYTKDGYIKSYYLLLINLICLKYVDFDLSILFKNNSELKDPSSCATTSFNHNEKIISRLLAQKDFIAIFPAVAVSKIAELNYILHFIYDINTQPVKTTIFIQFTENIHSGDLINHCLTSTFSSDSITIVHDPNEADIIISDTYEGDSSHAKRFYFENIYNQQLWKNLLQFITNSIYDHSFFREID